MLRLWQKAIPNFQFQISNFFFKINPSLIQTYPIKLPHLNQGNKNEKYNS